jgi:hypothetical protein
MIKGIIVKRKEMRIPFLGHFKVHFNEGMDKKCSFSEKILGFFGEN